MQQGRGLLLGPDLGRGRGRTISAAGASRLQPVSDGCGWPPRSVVCSSPGSAGSWTTTVVCDASASVVCDASASVDSEEAGSGAVEIAVSANWTRMKVPARRVV